MVKWRNVGLIFLREVRDQLRDRRTLFMVAVLPLLLYPALGIGMVQLTAVFSEQPRTVVLLGEEYLPPPRLIENGRFVSEWFPSTESARKLEVITDAPRETPLSAEQQDRVQRLLQQAQLLRTKLEEKQRLEGELKVSPAGDTPEAALERSQQLAAIQQELSRLFAASGIQVLVIIPQDFNKNVERVNQELAAHTRTGIPADYPRPVVVHNNADEKSQIAYRRVEVALGRWEDAILAERLKLAELPESLPTPIKPKSTNLALDTQISANLWSRLFPALLVIMSVTGAFYPAIDLGAGEKERGTMETLLICPASRTEIVLGKFLTVMCFSIATAILNLLSMGMTGHHMASMVGRAATQHVDLSLPTPFALIAILVFLIPLAAMFSALCLALATFARSSKEGQYYLTPLLMVTLGLTVFCLSPGVEITPFYSIMPVAGVALLLKGLLLAPLDSSGLYLYLLPVLVTTCGYSALALWWAIDQFQREEVLFRVAERFELGLWIRHLLRDKEPTPTFTEAGFCFVMIMLLQFAAFKAISNFGPAAGQGLETVDLLKVMLVQQIAIIASPALFMGVMLTTSLVRTFRLRLPRLDQLLLGAVLAAACHPLSVTLSESLSWFFPKLPEGFGEVIGRMMDPHQPLALVLLAFAVAPAICEELAFRGFILSDFRHNGRTALAIGLSSITFGVMHMIPQQVFNASLLGIVLGLIAVHTRSLFPCILFHFTFNTLAVMHQRIGDDWKEQTFQNLLVNVQAGQIRYTPALLFISAFVFVLALRYLIRQDAAGPREASAAAQNPSKCEVVAG